MKLLAEYFWMRLILHIRVRPRNKNVYSTSGSMQAKKIGYVFLESTFLGTRAEYLENDQLFITRIKTKTLDYCIIW